MNNNFENNGIMHRSLPSWAAEKFLGLGPGLELS